MRMPVEGKSTRWGFLLDKVFSPGRVATVATLPSALFAALSLPGPDRRSRVGEESDEVESAGQGGARVWRADAEVWIREGASPRIEEEHQSTMPLGRW